MRELPLKHSAAQTQKKDKQPKKVVDLEAEEGTKDIDVDGVDPITKFIDYIRLRKGKTKVTKDLDTKKFISHTPLLRENITFGGLCLAQVRLLKMEDWDLDAHERFPHLVMVNYMKRVYYKDSSVTVLELVQWIRRVEKSGLLNLLWVPHYHCSNINTTFIRQLLTLVHDGCLWLGVPIPITDMLIHRIMLLPHEGLNLAKEFGRKDKRAGLGIEDEEEI